MNSGGKNYYIATRANELYTSMKVYIHTDYTVCNGIHVSIIYLFFL